MFKRNDSGLWWMSIRHNGRRIQKSLETSDRKLAKVIEAKIRTEIVEEKYYDKPLGHNKTFKQLMERFMEEHSPKVSENTRKSYSVYLKHLDKFFGDSQLNSISPKTISRYKALRYEQGIKPSTINRERSMLSKAFNLAVNEWEWLNFNPVSRVPKEKENNERDRWLSEDEENRLFQYLPDWLADIVAFDLHTGLREDELLSLSWSRVELFRRCIVIKDDKEKKPKTIPLNRKALDILERKCKVRSIKTDIVFHSATFTKINNSNLVREFKKALKKAEIEDFVFHDLRHTFATRMVQRGIDIYKVSRLLGHKDVKTTMRYAHHSPESLRDGVEILDVDYNLTTIGKKSKIIGTPNLS